MTAKLSYSEITNRTLRELQWLADKTKSESSADSSVTRGMQHGALFLWKALTRELVDDAQRDADEARLRSIVG